MHYCRLVMFVKSFRQRYNIKCFSHQHAFRSWLESREPLFCIHSHLYDDQCVLSIIRYHSGPSSRSSHFFLINHHLLWLDYLGRSSSLYLFHFLSAICGPIMPTMSNTLKFIVPVLEQGLNMCQCTAFIHTWKEIILMRVLFEIFMICRVVYLVTIIISVDHH